MSVALLEISNPKTYAYIIGSEIACNIKQDYQILGLDANLIESCVSKIALLYSTQYPDGLDYNTLYNETYKLAREALDIIAYSPIFRIEKINEDFTVYFEKATFCTHGSNTYPIRNYIFSDLGKNKITEGMNNIDASIYADIIFSAFNDLIDTNSHFIGVDVLHTNPKKLNLSHQPDTVKHYVRCTILIYIKQNPKASNRSIAKYFQVDRRTVSRVRKKYVADPSIDFEDLRDLPKGTKPQPSKRIPPEVFMQLIDDMINHVPSDLNLNYPTWTGECIVEYLKLAFEININVQYIYYIFRKFEIKSKAGRRRNPKRSFEKIAKFVGEEYRKLCEEAKANDEILVFGDETGSQQGYNMRGYAPIGYRVNLEHCAETRHTGSSIFTILGPDGFCKIFLYEGTMNAQTFKECLKRLHEEYPDKKFLLILDNARVHHAKLVDQWLSHIPTAYRFIRLKYLPAYAPELNPVEFFNNYYKGFLRRLRLRTKKDVIDATKEFICQFVDGDQNETTNKVKSFFTASECKFTSEVYNEVFADSANG